MHLNQHPRNPAGGRQRRYSARAVSESRAPRTAARRTGKPLFDGTEFPGWYWKVPLSAVPMTEKLGFALSGYGSLGDLVGVLESVLLDVAGLGPTAPERLRDRVRTHYDRTLNRAAAKASARTAADVAPTSPGRARYDPSTPLIDHVRASLDLLKEREADILMRRIGVDAPPSTYEALAVRHGLSRGRIGQIQAKAFSRLDAATGCLGAVRNAIAGLRGMGFVPAEVLLRQPWAAGMPLPFMRTLAADLSGLYEVPLPWGGQAFVPFGNAEWEGFLRTLREATLSVDADTPGPDILVPLRERLAGEPQARTAFLNLVAAFLDGRTALGAMVALGLSQEAALKMIPREGEGADLDAVRLRFAAVTDHPPARENLREWIADHALHVGGNRFLLRVDSPNSAALAALCHATVAAGAPGRIWSTDEILGSLRATGAGIPVGTGPTQVEMALATAGRLERVHPFRWRDAKAVKARSVEELAEGILEENGAPMRHRDLGRAAFERWGTRKSHQIRMTGRLVMLGNGLWGLVDRDLKVEGCPNAVVRAAMECYEAGTRGIQAVYSELAGRGAHGGIANAETLASLLRLKAGLACGPDGTLKDPTLAQAHREGTTPRAVLEVLDGARVGLSTNEVVEAVCAATGHNPHTSYVNRLLVRYAHRGPGGKWFRQPQPDAPTPPPASQSSGPEPVARRSNSYPAARKPASGKRDGTHWRDGDIETLTAMWADGATALAISIALGHRVSRSAVLSKIHRLGLQRRDQHA